MMMMLMIAFGRDAKRRRQVAAEHMEAKSLAGVFSRLGWTRVRLSPGAVRM